jgi:hypothetical protein
MDQTLDLKSQARVFRLALSLRELALSEWLSSDRQRPTRCTAKRSVRRALNRSNPFEIQWASCGSSGELTASPYIKLQSALVAREPLFLDTGFDVRLDLQTSSDCLAVVGRFWRFDATGLHGRFDFHICPSPFKC